jgi:hypothetical protein
MKLSAPTALIFILSLILLALGIVAHMQPSLIAALPMHDKVIANQFWVVVAGYLVLTAGVVFRGL